MSKPQILLCVRACKRVGSLQLAQSWRRLV